MLHRLLNHEVKKGSADLLLLALLEERPRHGYEMAQLIEARSRGTISFRAPSLYPMLYRLERGGFIKGRWVEKAGRRRRRYYRLTARGRRLLAQQRSMWGEFIEALNRVARIRPVEP